MSEDILGYRNLYGGRVEIAPGIYWAEAMDAAKYLTMHRTAPPPSKELSSPNCEWC